MNHTKNILHIERSGKNLHPRMREYGFWIYPPGYIAPPKAESENRFEDCPQREFSFFSISHMHGGHGKLWLEDGRETEVNQGDCLIMTPGTVHRYGGINGKSYIEDTVDFGGPAVSMMQKAGTIRSGVFALHRNIRFLIPIIEHSQDPSVESQFKAVFHLQQLLASIYESSLLRKQENPILDSILRQINTYPQKWWTVSELAEMCRVTPTHLRRLFLKKTGLSPKAYIEAIKMNIAVSRLLHSELKIREIALSLGYRNQYQFSSRFKAVTGLSPKEYQKKNP